VWPVDTEGTQFWWAPTEATELFEPCGPLVRTAPS